MATLTLPKPMLAAAPGPKRWTVPEFHRLWESGWFEGQKAYLIDGEIITMPIPGPLQNRGVGKVDYALKRLFGSKFWVRMQCPLELNLWSDPVSDVAVVEGTPDENLANPSTALLVVEVSDSSLDIDIDTGDKAMLYAAAGIAEYWVLDLNNRKLIVHRDPLPVTTATSGFSFQNVSHLDEVDSIAPLALPGLRVDAGDLLPKL